MSYRPAMTGEHAGNARAPDAGAIEAAHAIYTPFMLSFYDRLVHGLSNRFAWRCPTQSMLNLYRSNLASRHVEAGVGTGFFIDRANYTSRHQPTLPGAVGAQACALPAAALRGEPARAHRHRA